MKRIAVLSDIHGNYLLLNKVLKKLSMENIEEFIVCGDSITDGFENERIINLFRKHNFHVILGNREESMINHNISLWENDVRWHPFAFAYKSLSDKSINYLKSLKNHGILEIDGVKILVTHGSPYNVRDMVYPNNHQLFTKLINDYQADVYLFGHTHYPFYKEYNGKIFINSGSVSTPVDIMLTSTYGILTIDSGKVFYEKGEVSYDFEEIKEYYLTSDFYKCCKEWCNLLLYTMRFGHDYCSDFVNYLLSLDDQEWDKAFLEYMKMNNLSIL